LQKTTIIVSVSNDLSNDQRVHRICSSLTFAGYDILLVGRKLKTSPDLAERNYAIKRLRLLFNKGFLFYSCLNFRLFLLLLFSKSDIFLSNDLDTLFANTLAAKMRRKKLVYDSHELFTEVPELQNQKFKKNFWLKIEKLCIKKANSSYTVCQSIADYYNDLYDINMQVIRNLPTLRDFPEDYQNRENILLYQGAINKDRGIDLMIKAVAQTEGYKFIIAGKGDLEEELLQLCVKLNLNEKVIFTGNLDFESLFRLTKTAKLGFSLEQGTSLNYKFALPNKIFDYIQAGVPVLCTDFPEMRRIVAEYGVGETIEEGNSDQLTQRIVDLLNNPDLLLKYSHNCKIAVSILNWESEENKLLSIFKSID